MCCFLPGECRWASLVCLAYVCVDDIAMRMLPIRGLLPVIVTGILAIRLREMLFIMLINRYQVRLQLIHNCGNHMAGPVCTVHIHRCCSCDLIVT